MCHTITPTPDPGLTHKSEDTHDILNEKPAGEDMDRQELLQRLDTPRAKFKGSVIPDNIENEKTQVVKAILERNITNLKRARSVAMYKLGMAAVLIVMEFLLAKFCRLDMARFMKWYYANDTIRIPVAGKSVLIELPCGSLAGVTVHGLICVFFFLW